MRDVMIKKIIDEVINRVYEIIPRIEEESISIEFNIREETIIVIELSCELEIEEITIIRENGITYDNVADMLFDKLRKKLREINNQLRKETSDWIYQQQFESIGGRYAYK